MRDRRLDDPRQAWQVSDASSGHWTLSYSQASALDHSITIVSPDAVTYVVNVARRGGFVAIDVDETDPAAPARKATLMIGGDGRVDCLIKGPERPDLVAMRGDLEEVHWAPEVLFMIRPDLGPVLQVAENEGAMVASVNFSVLANTLILTVEGPGIEDPGMLFFHEDAPVFYDREAERHLTASDTYVPKPVNGPDHPNRWLRREPEGEIDDPVADLRDALAAAVALCAQAGVELPEEVLLVHARHALPDEPRPTSSTLRP
jgi:hypothetical protein